MKNSVWFPDQDLDQAIFELSFLPETETVIVDNYYEDAYREVFRESKNLSPEKHKSNLQLLALSAIEIIRVLATNDLHEQGWLTADEQIEEANHFFNVEGPAILEDLALYLGKSLEVRRR